MVKYFNLDFQASKSLAILKALDVELPTRNAKFPNESPNKNEFHDTDMQDLTHHISWLRELLWDNKIVPFNDINLIKGL